MKHAKLCASWEYYYAKPPKEWNFVFEFKTADEVSLQVDASGWEYVLLQYEDGMFEVIIKDSSIASLDEDDRQVVAEIVLDGVLGEELRIQKIAGVDVVLEFSPQYENKSTNIKNLANHLKALIK